MSDTKHKPTPWIYKADGVLHEILDADNNIVCDWDTRGRSTEPSEAQGHLLAAAPELLAVCEVCAITIIELLDAEHPSSTDWLNVRVARNLALAAIAKAKP